MRKKVEETIRLHETVLNRIGYSIELGAEICSFFDMSGCNVNFLGLFIEKRCHKLYG